jgi:hypothetical protein
VHSARGVLGSSDGVSLGLMLGASLGSSAHVLLHSALSKSFRIWCTEMLLCIIWHSHYNRLAHSSMHSKIHMYLQR